MTAKHHGDRLQHLAAALHIKLLLRQGKGKTAGSAASRHDGYRMHLIAKRQVVTDDGVARLMVSDDAAVFLKNLMAFLLRAHLHLFNRGNQIELADLCLAVTGSDQGSFIHHIFKIGT